VAGWLRSERVQLWQDNLRKMAFGALAVVKNRLSGGDWRLF